MTKPTLTISRGEFIALCAMMFATIAFSIDSMLPALPEIAAELTPDDVNRAQLILTSFVIGMGLGTIFTGPLSDTLGRKPVVIGGAVLYCIGAALAWRAETLELVLAARVIQGIGVAGPRVVTLAIIRDLMEGRAMAQLTSIVMIIFTIVPAIAPLLGAQIIAVVGWRGIFAAFIAFSMMTSIWLWLRVPETLPASARRPFRVSVIARAARDMLSIPMVRISILVQTLSFAMLFTLLSVVQPIYDVTFARAEVFPLWFAGIALVAGSASLVNAALVMRLGMRFLVTVTLGIQVVLSFTMLAVALMAPPEPYYFLFFAFWQTSLFFQAGMTIGNLNAMAMQPLGHIAGLAASVIGAISTIFGGLLAIPVGLAFDGTPVFVALGIGFEATLAFGLMLWMRQIEAREE